MKTFDSMHCHQHREMDILVCCCFEAAFTFQTAPWGTVHSGSFMQKCLRENISAKYWGQQMPVSGAAGVFILFCELDVYVTTWINFQDTLFTERCEGVQAAWYHLSENQHVLMKKYRLVSLVCSYVCERTYTYTHTQGLGGCPPSSGFLGERQRMLDGRWR